MNTMHERRPSNHGFSWLTPLETNSSSNSSWVVTENECHSLSAQLSCRKVSVDRLLDLFEGVTDGVEAPLNRTKKDIWQSDCGRFWVSSQRQTANSMALFNQSRDDFYKRFELYIDGTLTIVLQDPVWPHLQCRSNSRPSFMDLPEACLDALDKEWQLRATEKPAQKVRAA